MHTEAKVESIVSGVIGLASPHATRHVDFDARQCARGEFQLTPGRNPDADLPCHALSVDRTDACGAVLQRLPR
jgi:hypothetical protein